MSEKSKKKTTNKPYRNSKSESRKKGKTTKVPTKHKNSHKPEIKKEANGKVQVKLTSEHLDHLFILIPVNFTIFGKLTKDSKKIIISFLKRNARWMYVIKRIFGPSGKNIRYSSSYGMMLDYKAIHRYINSIRRRQCMLFTTNDLPSANYNTLIKNSGPHFVKIIDTQTKKKGYMFAFSLADVYENYVYDQFVANKRIPAYIEIDPRIDIKAVKHPDLSCINTGKMKSYVMISDLGCTTFKNKNDNDVDYYLFKEKIPDNYVYRLYSNDAKELDLLRRRGLCSSHNIDFHLKKVVLKRIKM